MLNQETSSGLDTTIKTAEKKRGYIETTGTASEINWTTLTVQVDDVPPPPKVASNLKVVRKGSTSFLRAAPQKGRKMRRKLPRRAKRARDRRDRSRGHTPDREVSISPRGTSQDSQENKKNKKQGINHR